MDPLNCVILGIKVKPGPIERYKIENYPLDKTVINLKEEAEKRISVPSDSLELIYHGKVLKDATTLQDVGVKSGEMIHVVKKKVDLPLPALPSYNDAELLQIVTALRTFGCTPNAPGWTRAMQLLNEESSLNEIIDSVPSLGEECVTLSILHEVELLAALGATVNTMRRGAEARPDLPVALQHLTRLVHSRSSTGNSLSENPIPSGFAYSLEALSEDEDADDDEEESEDGDAIVVTQEQLRQALRNTARATLNANSASTGDGSSSNMPLITPELLSEAITQALNRTTGQSSNDTPMEQSTAASSSQSPTSNSENYLVQLQHMHEMGLLDDVLNMRALLISSGDVNAAINLVFSGAIGDD